MANEHSTQMRREDFQEPWLIPPRSRVQPVRRPAMDLSFAYTTSVDSMLASGRDPSNTFKDIRSSSKPKRRRKTEHKKYFGYEVVKPGQVSQPHAAAAVPSPYNFWASFPADLSTCPIVNLSKKQLYKEAQFAAPSYMWSQTCSCCREPRSRASERQEVAARAEAHDWNKYGVRRDFAGQIAYDFTTYDELAWMDVEDAYNEEWLCGCSAWKRTHDTCEGMAILGSCEGDGPQVVYDMEALITKALARTRVPVKEPDWEDLAMASWDSPELDWVNEELDDYEDEDFELI